MAGDADAVRPEPAAASSKVLIDDDFTAICRFDAPRPVRVRSCRWFSKEVAFAATA
jgi:hypothetical protein